MNKQQIDEIIEKVAKQLLKNSEKKGIKMEHACWKDDWKVLAKVHGEAIHLAIRETEEIKDKEIQLLKKRIWRLEGYEKGEMSLKTRLANQEETIDQLMEAKG